MRWLRKHFSDLAEKVLAGVVVAGIVYGFTFIPKIGPFLSVRVSLPVWLLLSIPAAAGAITWLVLRARAKRRKAEQTSLEKLVKKLDCEIKATRFSLLDLVWELTPAFWKVFSSAQALAANNYVNELIKGPFCPGCSRDLYTFRLDGYSRIESPCATCNREFEAGNGVASVEQVKLEVFKEAQRRARIGEIRQ